jgi:hypothetical protein
VEIGRGDVIHVTKEVICSGEGGKDNERERLIIYNKFYRLSESYHKLLLVIRHRDVYVSVRI